jgi:hypothetical protein
MSVGEIGEQFFDENISKTGEERRLARGVGKTGVDILLVSLSVS